MFSNANIPPTENWTANSRVGGNALAFLGFDDPSNKNAQRLVTRYEKYKAALPPWLSHDDRIV